MEIVAEFTYNHQGNAERAISMIDAAQAAGATCIKFELRNNETYFKNYVPVKAEKQAYEFSDYALEQVINYCGYKQMGWFASVHDIASLHKILPFEPRYVKVASREARLMPFIQRVKEITAGSRPIIVSTGGLSLKEVEAIYGLLKDECLTLLHTSCLYPCNIENLNINRIKQMKEQFKCKVGYSGHEQGILPSLYAVTLGATYIERHFTLEDEDKKVIKGKRHFGDELCTLGPSVFRELVNAINTFKQLQQQPYIEEVFEPELERVNAYGVPAWDGDVYVR